MHTFGKGDHKATSDPAKRQVPGLRTLFCTHLHCACHCWYLKVKLCSSEDCVLSCLSPELPAAPAACEITRQGLAEHEEQMPTALSLLPGRAHHWPQESTTGTHSRCLLIPGAFHSWCNTWALCQCREEQGTDWIAGLWLSDSSISWQADQWRWEALGHVFLYPWQE